MEKQNIVFNGYSLVLIEKMVKELEILKNSDDLMEKKEPNNPESVQVVNDRARFLIGHLLKCSMPWKDKLLISETEALIDYVNKQILTTEW